MSDSTMWRTGTKVPINVYEGDRPVCQCQTAVDARTIVTAVNKERALGEQKAALTGPNEGDMAQGGRGHMEWLRKMATAQLGWVDVCVTYGADKQNAVRWALATIEAQDSRLERITDLVRYQRHALFEAELISPEEYSSLVQHPGAVDRLEGYDEALAKLKHKNEELEKRIAVLTDPNRLKTTQCCDPVIDSQIGAANERIMELEGELAAFRLAGIPTRRHSDEKWRRLMEEKDARITELESNCRAYKSNWTEEIRLRQAAQKVLQFHVEERGVEWGPAASAYAQACKKLLAAGTEVQALKLALSAARECIEEIQGMAKTHEEVPQWGWPDYHLQMGVIRRVAGKGNAAAREALEGKG